MPIVDELLKVLVNQQASFKGMVMSRSHPDSMRAVELPPAESALSKEHGAVHSY
jgi:hypothetical protein